MDELKGQIEGLKALLAGTTRRRGIDLLAWLTCALQAKLDERSAPAFPA